MVDIIQKINHPIVEEMQAKFEVEMAELRSEMQGKIGELEEIQSNAESSISEQLKHLEKIFDGGKTLSVSEFKEKLAELKMYKWQEDWNVLSSVCEYLNSIKPEVRTETETITEIKETLPTEIEIDGSTYKKITK